MLISRFFNVIIPKYVHFFNEIFAEIVRFFKELNKLSRK